MIVLELIDRALKVRRKGITLRKNEIIRIHGTDYTDMTVRLLEAAGLADDIRAATDGVSDPVIGIKPNLVSPTPASFGATTHPEIVEGILLYLKEHGFGNLMICEGSWVGDKTEDAFEYCGYKDLAKRYGVTLFDTQKDSWVEMTCSSGLTLRVCSCVRKIDYLINVPVLKGHCQTKITCALKNIKGLIPNAEKRRYHKLGLHNPIAYLNTCIRQDFIVIDHICGDPDFEDGGNPLETNCIMAAFDPVLADAFACRILNHTTDEVPYIRLASSLGVGDADLNDLLLTELDASGLLHPAEYASSGRDPGSETAFLAHRILELEYATEEIESCSACYSALIDALNRLHEEGLLHRLTDEEHIRFCIGQGYRQKKEPEGSVSYIGIGSCTGCFEKNIPGCPPSGEEIYHYLKALISV